MKNCRLCSCPLNPATDADHHIIPETCIVKLSQRLATAEALIRSIAKIVAELPPPHIPTTYAVARKG